MTATPEEIAATPIELWTSCSWRRFHFAYPGRGPFAEPIKQRTDDHPDIWFSGGEATGHRMAACWNACLGMADPVSEIAEMRATIERQAAEIARLRAGGCARGQTTTQYCAEAVRLGEEVTRLLNGLGEIADRIRKPENAGIRIAVLQLLSGASDTSGAATPCPTISP